MQSAARFSAVLMQKTYSKWNASSGYHQTYFCHVSLFAIVAPPLLCPFWGLHDVCIRAFVYCALRLSLLAWLAYHFAAWSLYVPPAVGGLLFNTLLSPASLSDAVLGAVMGYGTFSIFYWLYRLMRGYEGLGYGDIKLLAALGAWHGWQSVSTIVLIASLSGLILGGLLFFRGADRNKKTPLPFGPFLVAAGFCTSWPTFGPLIMVTIKPALWFATECNFANQSSQSNPVRFRASQYDALHLPGSRSSCHGWHSHERYLRRQ